MIKGKNRLGQDDQSFLCRLLQRFSMSQTKQRDYHNPADGFYKQHPIFCSWNTIRPHSSKHGVPQHCLAANHHQQL